MVLIFKVTRLLGGNVAEHAAGQGLVVSIAFLKPQFENEIEYK
mgnify:CR=1 FL=1